MDSEPGEGADALEGSGSGAREARSGAEGSARERYGPVTLERHLKDDGRALLMYARADAERA